MEHTNITKTLKQARTGRLSSVEKEYELLRVEILQYLEEYQTVRNMMYVAVASILGFNSALWNKYYLFLLPLVVILPSYNIFHNYYRCVVCASTYIQTFLESDPDGMRWETRHHRFSVYEKEYEAQKRGRKRDGIAQKLRNMLKGHDQEMPYLIEYSG